MEGISQLDINKAVNLLKENLMFEVADRLTNAEIIPKLYVATYIEAVNGRLKDVHNNEEFDDLLIHSENEKLQLQNVQDARTKLHAVKSIIESALARKGQFCDFNDSKYAGVIKLGRCENENHYDMSGFQLTLEEQHEFNQINEKDGYHTACQKFDHKLNPDSQELTPMYFEDESTHKWKDSDVSWYCKQCVDSIDGDGEFGVSCDLETDF